MTSHGQPHEQHGTTSGTSAAPTSTSPLRLLMLLGLLGLAVFALWYDYKVARPNVEQAYETISALNQKINETASFSRMTNLEVQQALGRQPSSTFLDGDFTVEAYRWAHGMPLEYRNESPGKPSGFGLRTHDYFALYRQDGADLVFVTHFKFGLASNDLEMDVIPYDPARANEVASLQNASPGFAPTPELNPGGEANAALELDAGGRAGGFDPEAMFAERDLDGDGKLTGDEIPERMRERIEAIDTDGDGAISKDELVARMNARGGRDGGAGGPGTRREGGAGGERQQRPPVEPAAEPEATSSSTAVEPATTDSAQAEADAPTTTEAPATTSPSEE